MKHPAKFTQSIVLAIADVLTEYDVHGRILDPFAGIGGIHALHDPRGHRWTTGVELEPEWAAMHDRNRVGDATELPKNWTSTFDAVVTSPPYGNRMADKDMRPTVAATYMKQLGRLSSPGSANHLQWGDDYRELIFNAIVEMHRVLKHGGLLVFNMKNHPRGKQLVDSVGWVVETLETWTPFDVLEVRCVEVPGMRKGENRENIVEHEALIVARKP